ncbi:acetate kinase [Candidatus Hecatella orcuttiae]|uniref:acetate/propionate family kinase n=1 Tax=Candidatus Hecatella orcuttiae TaxID=1935119 RepID=UPI0028681D0D|nr:acetate kinase [Candidatus Hecatella orcuttiae]
MKVLVLNCGSSSIKYQLRDMEKDEVIAKGTVAKIGEPGSYIEHETGGKKTRREAVIPNHSEGLSLVMKAMLDEEHGVIKDLREIAAVGHRVVHGGAAFTEPALITPEVQEKIRECIPLAPLHNPANLAGITEAKKQLPEVPHVAVFDTAFHQTMPEKAYMYAVPREFYIQYGVRKYGFHGTSCRYVSKKAEEMLGSSSDRLKMIICHLGNGVTLNAVQGGKSVDTSMGLTPLEGLIMGTRCGDIDPGVIFYLHRRANLSVEELDKILNKKSGLLGVSGVSNDMREVIKGAEAGNSRCKLALEMYAYRVKKYIGAYAAAMGGLDVLVFTAGIGENSPLMRGMICENLEFLGVKLDGEANVKTVKAEGVISSPDSKVKVLVVPTDEEKMIALDTMEIAEKVKKI